MFCKSLSAEINLTNSKKPSEKLNGLQYSNVPLNQMYSSIFFEIEIFGGSNVLSQLHKRLEWSAARPSPSGA